MPEIFTEVVTMRPSVPISVVGPALVDIGGGEAWNLMEVRSYRIMRDHVGRVSSILLQGTTTSKTVATEKLESVARVLETFTLNRGE